jgi:predicted permease
VLSVAGLALGALFGRWVIGWFGSIRLSTDLPVRFDVDPDWRVAAFTALVALIAGVATGLAPAFHGTQGGVAHTLREGGRGGGAGAARQRLRSTLVVAQVAVSLVLLVCAGLFTRSVRNATRIDLGFRPDHLLMTSTDVAFQRYDSTKGVRFYRELLERAASLPGVRSVALSESMPLGYNNNGLDLYFDEDVPHAVDNRSASDFDVVSADYFTTLGLPIVAGRGFTRFDTDSSERVIVVSEAFARTFYPGKDAVGRHVRFSKDGTPLQIIGVAHDTKHVFVNEDAKPFVYRPVTQAYRTDMTLLVRTRGDPAPMLPATRDLFRQLDRDLPVYDAKTMEQHLASGISILFMRLAAVLAAAVGLLGLVQTVVGLYGVIAYGVSQRTREFGIRMALGARASDVVSGVLRQGAILTAIGLAIGLGIALAVTRLMSRLLVGVSTTDIVTFGTAVVVLALMALVSTYLPARRAARMEPVDALRAD